MVYDLESRTKIFSKHMMNFLSEIRIREINRNIISQLIKSTTSIGADYCEANNASFRKDFRNKIFICKKESQETKYCLELLAEINKEKIIQLRLFWQEAHELLLIFSKIISSL
ncbi:MAG: four helix bundle protein [Candidatus Buchananbacteria bacterium RIFCSPHIGHO2_02_FULL_40_13]|uniref:Four helix bundle protein n=1 Tax=Candidatus Buchananbacteria bacterium RIFCSPLOWO2_01_FULL_39_33 TaxID=1797543 RepID=A0A1G1YH32_9BACT|nr:MAG: four helix bundle protein [Candidatus Buchananbacteria bacterium RIFCSPHIGHO2_01_FULL_40_35]OGY50431.1 MAG: four helix bundle protein [Candidatus Buchananbacteria bacterium RIFCSPHIGHO2_02_FULL_40_13]OGY51571.1 MAG: four helix bundle protein [Candidatus Buchananbacteria bacterium RIFCSPLOWO2_01_FULL_39_33]